MLKFHDIRVSPEGILFKNLRILPESFAFPSELNDWKFKSVAKLLTVNYLLRGRRAIDRDVLWITDYWSTGYFHWLTDALPRLFVVRDRLRDLLLMLPATCETREFVKASLTAFAVPTADFIKPTEALDCRTLLMPTRTALAGQYNDEVIRGVRSVLVDAYGGSDSEGKNEKIYVSRKNAGKRRIVNEDEVMNILCNYDFQIIHAEEIPLGQQVQLFSETRYLISNHGAGLTNMLFMPEGGSVLELRHEADRIRNWFFILATSLNLNYVYQRCAPNYPEADPHYADLIVDLQKLQKNLDLMLQV